MLESAKMQTDMRTHPLGRAAVRRATQTVRRIDPWSVLKFSLLFYLSVLIVFLLMTLLLFFAASSFGIIHNVEKFVQGVGWPHFHLKVVQVFRALFLLGLANVIVATALNVFVCFLYNLVADVVGGIQVTISERDL